MSRLRIFKESDPATPEFASYDPDFIATELKKIGVTFERWKANKPIEPGASPEEVMDAYRADIDRLVAERGFKTVDVVSIAPDNPQREAMRAKFLEEHTHKEGAMETSDIVDAIMLIVQLPRRANVTRILIQPTTDVAPMP